MSQGFELRADDKSMTHHNEPSTPLAKLVEMHVRADGPTTLESIMCWCAEQWVGGRPDRDTVARILADPGRYYIETMTDGTPLYRRHPGR